MFNAIRSLFGYNMQASQPEITSESKVNKNWEETKSSLKVAAKILYNDDIDEIKRDVFHQTMGSQKFSSKKLRGNNLVNSVYSVLEDIKSLSADNNEFKKIIPLFETAYDLAVESFMAKNAKNKNFAENYQKKYVDNVKSKLDSLTNEGDKLLIPFVTQGHAILMEVTAHTKDGKITWDWKVYNAGLGSDIYHIQKGPLGIINPWAKAQTYEISGIDPTKINQDNFLNKLFFEQTVKKERLTPLKLILFITDKLGLTLPVYRHLKISLIRDAGGKFIKHKHELKPKSYHKAQKTGICSRKMYTLWLRENLSEINFRTYKTTTAETANKRLQKLKDTHIIEKIEPRRSAINASEIFEKSGFIKKRWYRLKKSDDTDTLLFFSNRSLKRRQAKLDELLKQRKKFERLFPTF